MEWDGVRWWDKALDDVRGPFGGPFYTNSGKLYMLSVRTTDPGTSALVCIRTKSGAEWTLSIRLLAQESHTS